MVNGVMTSKGRAPSGAIAKANLKKRATKQDMMAKAQNVEAKFRKSGGYGKAVVSIWDAPKGGIEKSPAYRKLLTRCELDAKGKPPPAELRNGAPVKGGFPLKSYPPNVLVDAHRVSWLPDDWAQVMKNTGPGGVYHGWMSPEGKFAYHKQGYPGAIEGTLGRKLTVMDGLNGMMRSIRKIVPPGADKKFLHDCLSPAERKHIAPKEAFLFGVVSGKRANIESGQHDIMIVEGHFKQVGIRPTWYVDAESLEDYKKLGLDAKVGGKLTPARNMVLDDAQKKNLVAVEISDDISKWIYYDCGKQSYVGEKDFKKANRDLLGVPKHVVSPLAAAQFVLAKMRSDPGKPHLGGVYPTSNAAITLGQSEFSRQHFILGDFFVAEPSSPCRFDPEMSLKEDYDYTCSHVKQHGCVLRCNRMFLSVKHATNAGGAVAARDQHGAKERVNIAILNEKWPGVFRINTRRKGASDSEVTMNWSGYGKTTSGPAPKKATPGAFAKKVKKASLKSKNVAGSFPSSSVVHCTKELSKSKYLNKRSSRCHGKTVSEIMGMKYTDASGNERSYNSSDLKYDINGGRLKVLKK
ncbi:unnamed protein product [Polarella glacialis]|uniref:Uncharacterized protein n=1 Tax=Polarella glacialis TaxID=89957 RepID=A0A813KRM0_POLGL|nr:unnamed protein product [Polarella glacialis]